MDDQLRTLITEMGEMMGAYQYCLVLTDGEMFMILRREHIEECWVACYLPHMLEATELDMEVSVCMASPGQVVRRISGREKYPNLDGKFGALAGTHVEVGV